MEKLILSDDQKKTKSMFIDFLVDDNKYMVIQGSAGCGKTTLVKHLIEVTEKQQEMITLIDKEAVPFTVELTAVTNAAAAVLQALTERQATTIHTFLGLVLKNNYKTGHTNLVLKKNSPVISNSIIFIDEASMINNELFEFIASQTQNCKIILIGDQYQLPPVKEKSTVMERLDCPKAILTRVMRHTGTIEAVGASFKEAVKTGKFGPIKLDGVAIEKTDEEGFAQKIREAFTDENYTSQAARVLSWTNSKVLQYSAFVRETKGLPATIQEGERVMTNNSIMIDQYGLPANSYLQITQLGRQFKNTGGVLGRRAEINGKVSGFLPNNYSDTQALLKAMARKKEWADYFSVKNTWLDLRFPYSSTVHKAQGDSFDTVFIDLFDIGRCNIMSDLSRLLYVAVTRAKTKVVLYGNLAIPQ